MIETLYNEKFYNKNLEGSILSATHFLNHIFSFYRPRSLVDFGCGIGSWLSVANELGVENVLGLDGKWVSQDQMINQNIQFRSTDLTKKLELQETFDLAISVEVAEHLEEKYANQFVDNLCNVAPVIIFGAAIPGQDGTNHINLQYQSYWIEKFKNNGFKCIDTFRKKFWDNDEVEYWYRQNTFLFIREDKLKDFPKELIENSSFISDMAHPILFNQILKKRNEIDTIRDAAIAFEKYDLLTSYKLMEKAHSLRPTGPFIKKKLEEYKKKLSKM